MEKNTLSSKKKMYEQRIEELKKQLENLKTKREKTNLIAIIAILSVGMIITAKMTVVINSMSLSEAVLSLTALVGGSAIALTSAIALSDMFFEIDRTEIEGDICSEEALLNWVESEIKAKLKKHNQEYTHDTKIRKSIERLTKAKQRLLEDQEKAIEQPVRKAPRQLTLGGRQYYRSLTDYRPQNK